MVPESALTPPAFPSVAGPSPTGSTPSCCSGRCWRGCAVSRVCARWFRSRARRTRMPAPASGSGRNSSPSGVGLVNRIGAVLAALGVHGYNPLAETGVEFNSLLGLFLDAVRFFLGFDAGRVIAPGATLFLLPLLHRSGLRRFLVLRAGNVHGLDRHLVRAPIGIGLILVERHLDRLLDRLTLAFDVGKFDDADQMMVAVYNRQAAHVVLGHQLPRLLHALVLEAADDFHRHRVPRRCRLGIA